jgi:hypothetical protein
MLGVDGRVSRAFLWAKDEFSDEATRCPRRGIEADLAGRAVRSQLWEFGCSMISGANGAAERSLKHSSAVNVLAGGRIYARVGPSEQQGVVFQTDLRMRGY